MSRFTRFPWGNIFQFFNSAHESWRVYASFRYKPLKRVQPTNLKKWSQSWKASVAMAVKSMMAMPRSRMIRKNSVFLPSHWKWALEGWPSNQPFSWLSTWSAFQGRGSDLAENWENRDLLLWELFPRGQTWRRQGRRQGWQGGASCLASEWTIFTEYGNRCKLFSFQIQHHLPAGKALVRVKALLWPWWDWV